MEWLSFFLGAVVGAVVMAIAMVGWAFDAMSIHHE